MAVDAAHVLGRGGGEVAFDEGGVGHRGRAELVAERAGSVFVCAAGRGGIRREGTKKDTRCFSVFSIAFWLRTGSDVAMAGV